MKMYRGRYEGKHRKATAAPVHGKTLRTGRLTTMVIATVLLLALAIGGTLAWLSTKDSPIQNKFLPTKVTCEVTERFDGSRGVKSNVNVKNTGTSLHLRWVQTGYRMTVITTTRCLLLREKDRKLT